VEDAGATGAAVASVAADSVVVAEAVDSAASAAAVRAAEVLPVDGNDRVAGDKMELLKELVTKLEHAFSDRLVSVVLYGSAASPQHQDRFSDLNVLCVLKQVMPQELMEGEPVLNWWREKGHPWPLLMSEDEVHNSADCFPIEFHDMKERRRVLYGLDVIAELKVDMRNYRTQVEHDLRSKLLRLRQQGASLLSQREKLLGLCVDSVNTFCVLGRHALELDGKKPKSERRAVVRQLAEVLHADMKPFEILLDIREDQAGADPGGLADPGELFAQYLVCISRMITFVDGLEVRG
jgi:predicted nucleotidyltransferase